MDLEVGVRVGMDLVVFGTLGTGQFLQAEVEGPI